MKNPAGKIRQGRVVRVFPASPQEKRLSFQRGADRLEIGGEGRAHTIHCCDDRNRDTGRDQTVFNRGRPRLIPKEFRH
jgi:hypothetical protein